MPPEYFCVGSSGLPGCGGPALTGGCTTDADCAGDATLDMVCVDNPCIGAPFTGVCLPGCTGSCGLGQTCTAGHCIAAPCTTDGDCPANFACNANACQMKACQTDSQCTGFCVNDLCSAQAGVCVPAPV